MSTAPTSGSPSTSGSASTQLPQPVAQPSSSPSSGVQGRAVSTVATGNPAERLSRIDVAGAMIPSSPGEGPSAQAPQQVVYRQQRLNERKTGIEQNLAKINQSGNTSERIVKCHEKWIQRERESSRTQSQEVTRFPDSELKSNCLQMLGGINVLLDQAASKLAEKRQSLPAREEDNTETQAATVAQPSPQEELASPQEELTRIKGLIESRARILGNKVTEDTNSLKLEWVDKHERAVNELAQKAAAMSGDGLEGLKGECHQAADQLRGIISQLKAKIGS